MVDRWGAAIGAGGALLGVALTGGFNLLRGRQEFRDKEAERSEQRKIMHREARREAYLDVLRKYHEADRKIQELWKIRPGPDSEVPVDPIVLETDAAILDLREACANVILEGPDEVARAAHGLWTACEEVSTVTNEIAFANHGSDQRLFQLAADEQSALEAERHSARGQFMRAASDAIGGRAPGFD
ncbi:hypothetical protein OG866_20680 [Streptomyces sp. NBC_00663]|uniref:hypothetical protein n=1 Tax=Streptomyces sp. NBC_00663 TaxID=2975801 RepID=UPI002E358BA8|nr:hypothetical protein [Streptomyces sp. NBC_00663]